MFLLPLGQRDLGPGVAVDLPGNIVCPAGKGRARLGQAGDRQQFAFGPPSPPRPPAAPPGDAGRRQRRTEEAQVTLGLLVDDTGPALLLLGPELGRVSECKRRPPQVERRLIVGHRAHCRAEQGRRRAGDRHHHALARRLVRDPGEPRGLGKARPHRHVAGFGSVQPVEVGLAQHRIFGDQAVMLEREDVGRDQPVGRGKPA